MKETIYLVVSKNRVERMTKTLPSLYQGEIPVKLVVEVAETAFREPVLKRKVTIDDWHEGVDIADIEFRKNIITEEEAEKIQQMRLDKMQQILANHGYAVAKNDQIDDSNRH